MPRSNVITVAELLGRNPGAAPHVRIEPTEPPRQVSREPWLTPTNKTSAAITFGSVLAVGTTLAVGSTLLPQVHHVDEPLTPSAPGPVTDSTRVTPHDAIQEPIAPARPGSVRVPAQGSARVPAQNFARVPAQGSPLVPAQRSARVPAQGSARVPAQGSPRVPAQRSPRVPAQRSAPAQGRHAASIPRGPHLDSHGNLIPTPGPSRSGRHRDSARPPSDPQGDAPDRSRSDHSDSDRRSGRSHSDRSGGGLLGGLLGHTLSGLSIGPL